MSGGWRGRPSSLILVSALIGVVIVLACRKSDPPTSVPPIMDSTRRALRQVQEQRVFFAHKSVGQNILDGLGGLLAETGAGWRIAEWQAGGPAEKGPMMLHATPGANGDPKSKMDGFAAALRQLDPKPDVALMKLCFADITGDTDVADLFAHYQRTISALRPEVPGVVIAHVTIPLSTHPDSAKARVYRLIGRSVWEDAGNVKRAEYSRMLREAFPGDPIFDLASAESTRPDGSLETFSQGGREIPALVPEYASDPWGHLNAVGQRVAASELIEFLAGVQRRAEAHAD